MSTRLIAYFHLTLAMLTVGSTVVASKIAAAGMPPFTATALRFAIALPCFLALLRWRGTGWTRLTPGTWLILLLQAAAGSVGYTTLLIAGMRHASAADASVILGTLPVVSALFAVLVLGERPRPALLAAVTLAAAGVLATAWRPGDGHSLLGNLLVFGAVVCEAVFILLNKRLPAALPPLIMSTLMVGIGLVASLPAALLEAPWQTQLQVSSLVAVIYYALVPTVAGFLCWYAGAARVSGAEAALFTAVAPVSALLMAALLLGEDIGLRQTGGIACVLIAMLVLGWMQRAQKTAA